MTKRDSLFCQVTLYYLRVPEFYVFATLELHEYEGATGVMTRMYQYVKLWMQATDSGF